MTSKSEVVCTVELSPTIVMVDANVSVLDRMTDDELRALLAALKALKCD
jgi:hypothetical protein